MGRGMGIPGMGIPGMGGGRRGGGGGGAQQGQSFQGIVRWESAKPILDALKQPPPEGFTDQYVISVGGIPLDAGNRRRYQSQDDSSQPDQNALDRLKGATYLLPKDKSSRLSWSAASRLRERVLWFRQGYGHPSTRG
jgi:hypothetical protein